MTDTSKPGVSLPLHRARFVDWTPSSITALAFSPVPPMQASAHMASSMRSVLAIGRDNGDIDVCTWCEDVVSTSQGASISKGWMPEVTLLGDTNYKIESLAFTLSTSYDGVPYLRLFSTSGGSIISEHFLPPSIAYVSEATSRMRVTLPTSATRTLSSQGGTIWSMAASPTGKYLAIGCEDGVVRLINVAGDAFEHVVGHRAPTPGSAASRMSRVASRILSLAWGPPQRRATAPARRPTSTSDTSSDDECEDDDTEAWTDTYLLGGLGNSTAVVWDVSTGHLRSRLTVLKNRNEHTIVWAVAVLRDGTLVTGDSTGRVTFFDGRTRVPIPGASFQCHTAGADVLTLCVSSDSRAVYSAGVDQKVAEYTFVGQAWAHTGTRRLHAHDIRALAMDPPLDLRSSASSTPSRMPILVSGGLDYHLVLTPASHAAWRASKEVNPISSSTSTSFADTTQRRVAFVPASAREGVVCVAPGPRYVVLRREQSVGIWQIEGTDAWRKVLEMELRVKSNLGAVAISSDGRFLAVSDLYETKLFDLSTSSPRRVPGLGAAIHRGRDVPAPGASSLLFTPDSTRLVLCTAQGAFVHVLQLPTSGTGPVTLLKSFTQHRSRRAAADGRLTARLPGEDSSSTAREAASARDMFVPIVLAAVSPDGQWLLTADTARHMHVFHLDTLSHQRALASPSCVPSAACFHPSQPNWVCVTLPTNHVLLYDVEGDTMPSWEATLRQELDTQLGRIREPVVGCTWVATTQGATLVLYGPTWLCTARASSTMASSRKKRRSSDDEASMPGTWSIRTTFKYQPLLYVGALAVDKPELLVIERPYFALAQSLPPAFYRGAKYGM